MTTENAHERYHILSQKEKEKSGNMVVNAAKSCKV